MVVRGGAGAGGGRDQHPWKFALWCVCVRLVVRDCWWNQGALDIHPADAAVKPRNRQEQSSDEGQVVNVTAGSFLSEIQFS